MSRLLRILLFGAFVAAVLLPPVRLLATGELARYRRLRAELDELRQRTETKQKELTQLRALVGALHDDKAAVERVARDELGLVGPGEVVFALGAADGGPADGGAP